MSLNDDKHLSWFLGPKAENADVFITGINTILQDYIHWRRNYFPQDHALISKKMQREFEDEYDALNQNVAEMMSLLRRNFPFYSPRYIAHMLSDITLPSMLGYFAGMLYNANNVTPEASPVAVEMEIDACNEVLKMIGFKPSPVPPKADDPISLWENYQKELKEEFGWAHITSGGTVANIEALWVARIVKYFPLAVKDIAIDKNLSIAIKKPDKTSIVDIKEISNGDLIGIKPNESIFLYAKLIDQLAKEQNISVSDASKLSSTLLSESKYSITNNLGLLLTEFPPVIFCSGAAHYSVKKAADILGLGKKNVILVDTDSNFRMSCNDLKIKMQQALNEGKFPIAVVAVGATTEEGAVDPIKQIVDFRNELEKSNQSFWLHIDSAWGGYINAIFNFKEDEEFIMQINKIGKIFSFSVPLNIPLVEVLINFIEHLKTCVLRIPEIDKSVKLSAGNRNLSNEEVTQFLENMNKKLNSFEIGLTALKSYIQDYSNKHRTFDITFKKNVIQKLHRIIEANSQRLYIKVSVSKKDKEVKTKNTPKIEKKSTTKPQVDLIIFNNHHYTLLSTMYTAKTLFGLDSKDIFDETHKFVSDNISFTLNNYQVDKHLRWEDSTVFDSFLNFKNADSITIDPHKLGYIQYPCGVVAFRNDRIRHMIMQRAPYITSSGHSALIHNPPRHLEKLDFGRWTEHLKEYERLAPDQKKLEKKLPLPFDEYRLGIDAFAPFMLEGSKPGAAATALWLASKVIPLDRQNHGLIIKSSLIAARELYEWLSKWNEITKTGLPDEDINYEFKTFSYPDTNVVVFVIKNNSVKTIVGMNTLAQEVYGKFTINAENGSRDHSYNQPFFLSKTVMDQEHYKYDSFNDFFNSCGLRNSEVDYKKHGLIVLRATLMNPYITPTRQINKQNLIKEFVWELHLAAKESVRKK